MMRTEISAQCSVKPVLRSVLIHNRQLTTDD